jgi:glycosyltransferase involved in cell wall biosynthesis
VSFVQHDAKPLVSVVIPARNRQALLRSTIDSVYAQTYARLEIIVIDDGSTEPLTYERSVDRARPVTFFRNESAVGVAAARNAGIAQAQGRFVAFLDDDDLWAPNKVAAQVAALDGRGPAWSATGAVEVDSQLRILRATRAPHNVDLSEVLLEGNVIPGGGSGVIADRELLVEVGGFDESLAVIEDWDLWLRLAQHATFAAIDRPLVAWRLHGGNETLHARGEAELARLQSNHAAAYARTGVRIDRGSWLQWEAESLLRAGRRTSAARRFSRAAIHDRSWRTLRRAALAIAHRDPADAIARRRADGEDPQWSAEAIDWLSVIARSENPPPQPPSRGMRA